MQLRPALLFQPLDLCNSIIGRVRRGRERRNETDRKIVALGGRTVQIDRIVGKIAVQVRDRRDALYAGRSRIAVHVVRCQIGGQRISTKHTKDPESRRDALKFARRSTLVVSDDAGDIDRPQQASTIEDQGIDVADVKAGVNHHDRPRRRDLVQMPAGKLLAADVQGIETPCEQRRIRIGKLVGGFPQSLDDPFNVADTLNEKPFRGATVTCPDVRHRPDDPFHDMAVTFHEARKQDFVGKSAIHFDRPRVGTDFLIAADGHHPSFMHRNMSCRWP